MVNLSATPTSTKIPLFPQPFCAVEAPETKCTWLGITVSCREPITYDTPFTSSTEGGHVWVFIVLFTLGISALAYAKRPWRWNDSMKVIAALYSAETAFFALFRVYWGLGKPLIAGAALHNLFEWAIVFHLISETQEFGEFVKYIRYAGFWILSVVSVSIMIPNLLLAFLLEQSTGIMLDFAMPMMFVYMWLFNSDQQVRDFYKYPAVAHTLHILFTILPLVLANFHVGFTSWYSSFFLEVAIYVSAPMTHILYIAWAPKVDNLRAANKDGLVVPKKYRIKGTKWYFVAGFLCGLAALIGYPRFVLGPCPPPVPECQVEGAITATSTVLVKRGLEDQFVSHVKNYRMIEHGVNAKGNIDYKIVQNSLHPREFKVVETWKDFGSLSGFEDKFGEAEVQKTIASAVSKTAYKELDAACAIA